MAKTLTQLTDEALLIEQSLSETGELTPELEIKHDDNKKALADKLDRYCWAMLSIEQKIKYLENLKKQVDAKMKSLNKQTDYLMAKIESTKEIHNFSANQFKFGYRKSTSVKVDDIYKLPMKYVKVETTAIKKDIAEALKSGEKIEGASLTTNETLSFKEKL